MGAHLTKGTDWIGSNTQRYGVRQSTEDILEQDMNSFLLKTNMNGFLNHVLVEMMSFSDVCINNAIRKKRAKYIEILVNNEKQTGIIEKEQIEILADVLANAERGKILKKYKPIKKGKEEKFSATFGMDNTLINALNKTDWNGFDTNGKAAFNDLNTFLSALLEDYASRPLYERELIYFNDIVNIIEQALNANEQDRYGIAISFKSVNGTAPAQKPKRGRHKDETVSTGELKDILLMPYSLELDAGENYYYVTGMARPQNAPDAPMYPVTYRLSRLESAKICKDIQGLSKTDSINLKKLIQTKGVQYIGGVINKDDAEATVVLTRAGMQQYRKVLHNRPKYKESKVDENGNVTMTFMCSPLQLEFYFFQFGNDAEIIAPSFLHEKMLQRYQNAADQYKK